VRKNILVIVAVVILASLLLLTRSTKAPVQFTGFATNRNGQVEAIFAVDAGGHSRMIDCDYVARASSNGRELGRRPDTVTGYFPNHLGVPLPATGATRVVFKIYERTRWGRVWDGLRRIRLGAPRSTPQDSGYDGRQYTVTNDFPALALRADGP